jgi:hypothetical protein|tara:strand:+ start:638 stop:832 length:195 start_codon:yes stop_codon:yes gene_type:complete
MFEGCKIKYVKEPISGKNACIRITYPDREDGSHLTYSVPLNEQNALYQQVQEWVAEGNTIEEAD